MTPNPNPSPELLKTVNDAAVAYAAFVDARNRMNAAVPAIDGTKAERDLYDERYKADHAAEREHFRTAISLAHVASAVLAALSPQTLPAPGEVDHIADAGKMIAADHNCPACPVGPRDIGAVLHNLVGQLERGGSILDERSLRKLADARAALDRWKPIVDAHFAAVRP